MSSFELDTEFVRQIALLLKETGLNEIEYAEGQRRIRCVANAPIPVQAPVSLPVQVASAAPVPAPSAPATAAAPEIAGTPVTSPMVGTVYMASEPGAAPFVKVGDTVKQGDTLLIIEAMKVMNPIKAPKAGTIAAVLVDDAKPVEFGETLIVIA